MSEEALERACTDAATICLAREPCDAEGQMREALLRDLEHAVARGELRLEFQPQVQIDDGQIVGFEALLRWQHPRYGLLGPGRFIALAEAGGQIGALSEWVLEHALAQLAEWEAQGHDGLRIAVNMPPALMALPAIEALLRQRLEQTGLKGQQIELELTESSLVAAKGETIARIERLRRLGVRIAIDDFGTGYSNLGYLSRLPVDCVKIDLSFTQAALANPSDAAICRMICNLAQTLQLRVVVEGVETEGQLHFFADLPCHEAQGYLFSRPLAPEAATDLLARGKRFSAVRQPRADGAGARHLLLLDDEEFVLSSLRRLLRRTGVRVHIANTPEQAFELLAREPIGVVISDQRMPAMSGTEFLRRVKSLHPDTIRIVLSGYTELQSIADAINEGAIFRFLTKPWNDEQLIRHIEQAFEQYEVVAENRRLQAELQALRDAVNDARAGKAECIVVGSRAPGRAGLTAGAAR
jgi:EAL domain-containing protein (putative c-di-GMP-specific phosphodiesterase class I)/FixJ family two-component response regulator